VLYHPDKASQQGITKEEAEKKMHAINEAYEILKDPELKARFDRGDDPNNPELKSLLNDLQTLLPGPKASSGGAQKDEKNEDEEAYDMFSSDTAVDEKISRKRKREKVARHIIDLQT